ncbi:MAG: TIGR04086 family membrane protein [Firmicutes bacterium]|nr:TIGR04086 family membrane protein [Bacillota bacterium]
MKNDNEAYRPAIPAILRGIVTAAAVTLISMLICALVMTFGSGTSEKAVYTAMQITGLAAVFLGSLTAGARSGRRGLVSGLSVGLIYTLAMVFTGFMITPDYTVGTKTLITLAVSLVGGILGGVLGVNIK